MRLRHLLLAFLLVCGSGLPQLSTAQAKSARKKKTRINVLAIAAVLIRDGHLDRARIVLRKFKADPKATLKKQRARKAEYHMMLGIIYTKKGLSRSAVKHYEQAIQHGMRRPLLYVFLAQGYFKLSQYQKALKALAQAPQAATNMPGTYLLKAQSLWRLKRHVEAYRVLQRGHTRHPTVKAMLRLQILLLIELKLSREAYKKFRVYIRARRTELLSGKAAASGRKVGSKAQKSPQEQLVDIYVMFAGAFRRQQLRKTALLVLEEARLWTSHNPLVLLQLARLYLELQQGRTAAGLLERAARTRPKLMVEAAELYRRAGMLWRALYLNAQVNDQKAKIRQRLGLLIELKRFEEAAALAPRLSRLGLLRDQKLVYALAYSCYKTGRYREAKRWLGQLSERELFQKAIVLRKAIQSCAKRQWWCP